LPDGERDFFPRAIKWEVLWPRASVTSEMAFEQHLIGRDLFKLDITQIPLTDSHNFLALLNFNIPADHPDIEGCLQNIVGFLERNFGVENQPSITYQVTASYYLRRPDNGDERIWTGSFVAGSDQNCSLSGHLFALYDRESFAGVFRRSVSHQNVVDRLTWRDVDTEWQFSHVESYIVSFQLRLDVAHPFFLNFGLPPADRRGQARRHVTIIDPA